MDFLKKNKTALGGILVVGLVFYLYYIQFGGNSGEPLTEHGDVGSELLTTLSSLHTIKLDQKVFDNPTFKSLSDFGVTIPPQESGRRNPFAPIGQ